MRKLIGAFLTIIMALASIHILPAASFSGDTNKMEKQELKNLLGNPDIVLIDARKMVDWTNSEEKIPGAIRRDPYYVSTWAQKFSKYKKLVIYSADENEKTNASVQDELKSMGFTNVYALQGGWHEWKNAGYPIEIKNK